MAAAINASSSRSQTSSGLSTKDKLSILRQLSRTDENLHFVVGVAAFANVRNALIGASACMAMWAACFTAAAIFHKDGSPGASEDKHKHTVALKKEKELEAQRDEKVKSIVTSLAFLTLKFVRPEIGEVLCGFKLAFFLSSKLIHVTGDYLKQRNQKTGRKQAENPC